jgi:ABC-type sugar transport system substrate-binding protein
LKTFLCTIFENRRLKDTINRNYPNIEISGVCEVPNNEIEIYKTVKKYFQKNQDVTCLWYATSISDGGIIALNELNLLNKIRILSIDLQDFTINGLLNGYIFATISQKPFQQGYHTMKVIFNHLLIGKTENLKNYIENKIIIKESLSK